MELSHLKALNLSFAINALMNLPALDMAIIEQETNDLMNTANVSFIHAADLVKSEDFNDTELLLRFDSTADYFFDKINSQGITQPKIYEIIQNTVQSWE